MIIFVCKGNWLFYCRGSVLEMVNLNEIMKRIKEFKFREIRDLRL